MLRFKYKKFHLLFIAVSLILLFYKYAPGTLTRKPHQAGLSAIAYNHNIKTEYGTPIKVARAIDGDTIELINGDRLRYIGIDTPEEFDPRKPVQCFASEAAEENKNLVEGKLITFYKDISPRDRYGRWLGLVYLNDGTFINQKLIEDGFAFSYPYKPDTSHENDFIKSETKAKKLNLGLWAHCQVYKNSSGHEQTNNL